MFKCSALLCSVRSLICLKPGRIFLIILSRLRSLVETGIGSVRVRLVIILPPPPRTPPSFTLTYQGPNVMNGLSLSNQCFSSTWSYWVKIIHTCIASPLFLLSCRVQPLLTFLHSTFLWGQRSSWLLYFKYLQEPLYLLPSKDSTLYSIFKIRPDIGCV